MQVTTVAATSQHDYSSQQPLPFPSLTNYLTFHTQNPEQHLNIITTQLQAFITADIVTSATPTHYSG